VKKSIILLIILGIVAGLSAAVMWTNDVAIRQGVNIEWFRTGTDTNDGCAIYVWSDTKLGERDLWAQKVDAQGNMVWGEPLLVDGKPDRQEDPVIVKTSDGNFIIAWIEFDFDQDGDVYAQKINTQGQLLWQQGGKPVCTLVGGQISLNIEPDNAGGAYIVWEDSRNPSKDIYGQRLDNNGNAVWATDGIPIASGIGNESQNTMWADGTGGMIIGYHHTYAGEQDIYVKRFSPTGEMVWGQPLELAVLPGVQSKIRMAPLGNGDFVFTWQDERNGVPDVYAQKINLNGQLLWSNPYIVHEDLNSQQQNPRIVGTSDNAVIIFWEDNRLDFQNPDIFAQKINAAGTKLWNPSGIIVAAAEFAQSQPRMASDGNGGCYVVWDDDRNGNVPNTDIYAQHLNASGQALWGANGKAICNAPYEQSGSLVKVAGNNVFINWMDMRNGSVGINYQVLNPAGTEQIAEDGVQVFWGLSGDAILDQFLVLPRQNDAIAIWQDTRHANLGYQIYFQAINEDGSVDYETNGRSVTLHTGNKQAYPHAAISPDGHICVVWEDFRNENPKIYAQLISPTGERLWGDYGMVLTDATPLAQNSPKVSYKDGSYYIGWSNAHTIGTEHFYHTYGQKITAGVKQWGPNGILISYLEAGNLNNECLFADMDGRYFAWTRTAQDNPSLVSVWVKYVNEDGTTAAGWPAGGLKASTYDGFDIVQVAPKIHRTPQGIFVTWGDLRTDFLKTLYGQHIGVDGAYLWDSSGVPLADAGREQYNPSIDVSPWGITIIWEENLPPEDIAVQRYSFSGQALWGSTGSFVVQKPETQKYPELKRFANGGMLALWSDYAGFEPDIYYRYVNDNMSFVGDALGNPVCTASKSQYRPLAAPTANNVAIVVWPDGRSSGKTEILGLYAQKISNECVSNSDPLAAPPVVSIEQNFPNPFNPETTIRFNVLDTNVPVNVSIYNAKGQKIRTLYSGVVNRGSHIVVWNGTDDANRSVSSGLYFYKVESGKLSQTRKMVLMK